MHCGTEVTTKVVINYRFSYIKVRKKTRKGSVALVVRAVLGGVAGMRAGLDADPRAVPAHVLPLVHIGHTLRAHHHVVAEDEGTRIF